MTGPPAGLPPAAADAPLPDLDGLPPRRWLLGARLDEAVSGLAPRRNQVRWFRMQAAEDGRRLHAPALTPAMEGFST